MNIIFFLIPLSLVLLGLAIWAFFWAVKHDQFEDLEGPAYSILFDDEDEKKPGAEKQQEAPDQENQATPDQKSSPDK
ncbi:cbb3-type cytochrome oxidase assembly protein CcoS [Marinospirillum perlucidum]|uniref:cbb3-type cytochrome oxidase assembly protein CcoS n=1 Tax=Marinospirillum perlucidum TaxID=1982602 RepID=UPI000DF33762|nr:cbb3-type cytochrome oxidase assembly protein CcoS [Marinospirillum perlucidum]